MKIWSYALSMADDADCLPDALNSLAHFSDRIFVTDGLMGAGTLCHTQRLFAPIGEWLKTRKEYDWDDCEFYGALDSYTWNDVPLTLYENSFRDPAHQRNYTLDRMAQEPDQPDFVVWIDSDEICSWEFINGIRPYLETLPKDVVGVCPKWLTLVQDERHCVKSMSDWLAHPRIHKPNAMRFQGSWHEHGNIDRAHVVKWDTRIIHTRALFTNRLKIQRGHDGIVSGNTPMWANAIMVNVPDCITWPEIHWPDGEMETLFK